MSRNYGFSTLLIGASVILLAACGGSSNGTASGGAPVQMTAIATSQQGSQASYGGAQAALLANAVSSDSVLAALNGTGYLPSARQTLKSGDAVYDRMGGSLAKLIKLRTTSFARSGKARAGVMAATTEVIQCSSGYYDSSVSSTLTSFSLTETYFNCDDGAGTVLNGTLYYSIGIHSLDSISITLRFGNGDSTLDPADFTIVTTAGGEHLSTATASLTFRVDLSAVSGTVENYNLDVNGLLTNAYTNSTTNGSNASQTDSIQYDRYSARVTWDSATSIWSQRVNGGLSLTRLNDAVSPAEETAARLVYRNLGIDGQLNPAGNTSLTISGTISTDFTPDLCYEGTFSFVTIAPLEFDAATSLPVAGHLVINNAVHVVFNPDSSVSVSLDGGVTYANYTRNELEGLCLLPHP